MDRTIIAPYKAEEKELSDKLYKKLEGLMLMFPPTEEFRRFFTSTMFLKANQQAFFHVMHYLFRLHDPTEFKKRFYWPITDKRSEAGFRSATVDYLKFLSDKHMLNWNIKQYLVVMPGGMKFITFMLELVAFVIQEQVRHREKQLGAEISTEEICELNLKRMERQNQFFKEYASDYINEVDAQIMNLTNRTQKLKIELLNLESKISGININKEFLKEFQLSNKQRFEEKLIKNSQSILSLEKLLNDLKESVEKFQNKATEQRKDKSNIKQALQKITPTVDSSVFEESVAGLVDSADAPTINSLVNAFVLIQPTMENWLCKVAKSNNSMNGSVTSEINEMKIEFEQIKMQIVDFQKKYNPSKIKNKDITLPSRSSNIPLLLKYVYTPPIKSNVAENISARLPLQDDTTILDQYDNYLSLTQIRTTRTIKKEHPRDQSLDLNSTLNQSKIIDPVQLLRTIYKDSAEKTARSRKLQPQQRENLSLLGLKWKQRQQTIFGVEKEPETSITVNKTLEPLKRIDNISTYEQVRPSPQTPFNTSAGEITRIAISTSYEKSPSTILLKKSSVVKKVQNASLNIQNLSTSPSGRLDPLVPVEEFSSLSLDNVVKLSPKVVSIDNENNANLLNTPIRFSINVSGLNDDAIFNTSDTLLNEIL